MRGKQPDEVLWKETSRCKGTGVGMSREGQKDGSTARPQHASRREQEG